MNTDLVKFKEQVHPKSPYLVGLAPSQGIKSIRGSQTNRDSKEVAERASDFTEAHFVAIKKVFPKLAEKEANIRDICLESLPSKSTLKGDESSPLHKGMERQSLKQISSKPEEFNEESISNSTSAIKQQMFNSKESLKPITASTNERDILTISSPNRAR